MGSDQFKKKVYILDYEVVSPLGCGKNEVLDALRNNVSGEGPISAFDTTGVPFGLAAEVRTSLDHHYAEEPEMIRSAIRNNRKFELLVTAYSLIKERIESIFALEEVSNKGVIIGLGAEAPPYELLKSGFQTDNDDDDPFFEAILQMSHEEVIFSPYDFSAIYLAEKLQLGAFQRTSLTACTASTQSVILSAEAIQNGEADLVLAGGADSIITDLAMSSFNKLGVLAEKGADGRTCKPFDVTREGTLAGEAAGLCVLASEDFVRKHQMKPKFELLSYGNTLDAYQITSPDPEGKGVKRALREALKNSGVNPSDLGYINLHGTGTRQNDIVELESLMEVFGEDIRGIPMSSTKDRHGHAIAAAGIQELSMLCISLESGLLPCNLNLQNPLKPGEVDLIMGKNREEEIDIGMTCNYSFGGVNSVLIIRKMK